MARDHSLTQMAGCIRVSGSMASSPDTAFSPGPMVTDTRDSTKMAIRKEKGPFSSAMAKYSEDDGSEG
jgi:hypothetical protein